MSSALDTCLYAGDADPVDMADALVADALHGDAQEVEGRAGHPQRLRVDICADMYTNTCTDCV